MVALAADAAPRTGARPARGTALSRGFHTAQSPLPQGVGARGGMPLASVPRRSTLDTAHERQRQAHLSRLAQPATPRTAQADRRAVRTAAAARGPAARRRRGRDTNAGGVAWRVCAEGGRRQ